MSCASDDDDRSTNEPAGDTNVSDAAGTDADAPVPTGSDADAPDAAGFDTGDAPDAAVSDSDGAATANACMPRSEAPFQRCEDVEPPVALIEDFEAGDYATVAAQSVWFTYDDGSNGSLHVDIEEEADSSVLYAVSGGWTVWGAGLATLLHKPRTCEDYCTIDASAYGGVRFRARGQGNARLRLATSKLTPVAEGGSCELGGENCYDWPGAAFELGPDWQTFSVPFCRLFPEGWGVSPTDFQLDARDLGAVHFRLENSRALEMWLDDLEFYGQSQAPDAEECRQPCPLDAAPLAAFLEPAHTDLELSDELTLHTFEQETTNDCGRVTRRYLSYVPTGLEARSDAPVLFALHGSGANAESMQELQMRGGMDELAARDGFIVVYGNAAPGAHTQANPYLPNSGAWRQDFYDDGQVDDVEYLQLVLAHLRERGVIGERNPVYLTGLSNGGGMVLEAAKRAPDMFAGIAPFMPFDGWQPTQVPDLVNTRLTRVLFGYAPEDPGLPDGYTAVLERLPAEWAAAMAISQNAIDQPILTELPDAEVEGRDYRGSAEAALATQNSRVVQLDISDSDPSYGVRILRYDRAGHFWPHPVQDEEDWVLERWGFRNQDLDASRAVVEFLMQQ